MKRFSFLLMIIAILTGCGPKEFPTQSTADGYLCVMGEQYVIYSYDFEQPVELERDELVDEDQNLVSPEDLSLGMPVTLYIENGEAIHGSVNLAQFEAFAPSHFPSGFVLSSCLFYKDAVFEDALNEPIDKIPEDFPFVLTITTNSGVDLPAKEGEACHVALDSKVYASESTPDWVYVETDEGYLQFIKVP